MTRFVAWVRRTYGPVWLCGFVTTMALWFLVPLEGWQFWVIAFVAGFVGAWIDDALGFTGPSPTQTNKEE